MDHEAVVNPGFYAAGAGAGNAYGECCSFVLPGKTIGSCIFSGRIAGENAAAKQN